MLVVVVLNTKEREGRIRLEYGRKTEKGRKKRRKMKGEGRLEIWKEREKEEGERKLELVVVALVNKREMEGRIKD